MSRPVCVLDYELSVALPHSVSNRVRVLVVAPASVLGHVSLVVCVIVRSLPRVNQGVGSVTNDE